MCDSVAVVEDHTITCVGTHDVLLAKNGKYAAMWNAKQNQQKTQRSQKTL